MKDMNNASKIADESLNAANGGALLTITGDMSKLEVGTIISYERDTGIFGKDVVKDAVITQIIYNVDGSFDRYIAESFKDAIVSVYPEQILTAQKWGDLKGPTIN